MECVNCRSEYSSCDYPTTLCWQGQHLKVEKIEKEWYEPNAKCYIVTATGKLHFELRLIENRHWHLRLL